MEKRLLGRTGEWLSILGFGGILVMNETQKHASSLVSEAVERGINYFDVAPTYGNAQNRLGPAIKPHRKKIFLACKTTRRDKINAEAELHQSLKLLKTDYFDLYQLHGLANMKETRQALGYRGALRTILKAREQGLIRYIGFSVHDTESAIFAMNEFDFDTILFPVNFVNYYSGRFGPVIETLAVRKELGLLALKSMALTKWPTDIKEHNYAKCWYEPISEPKLAKMALRFTLSRPVTSLLPPGEETLFRMALDYLEKGVKPISHEDLRNLKRSAKPMKPIFQYAA